MHRQDAQSQPLGVVEVHSSNEKIPIFLNKPDGVEPSPYAPADKPVGANLEPRRCVSEGFKNLALVEIEGNGRRTSVCHRKAIF